MATLAAPYNLSDSLKLGTGVWRVGESRSYPAPDGSTLLVPQGLVDIGEIETGDIAIDPGTATNFRTKRVRTRDIRKTTPGEGSVTVELASFSTTFENLGLFFGGDISQKSQAATPVVDETVLGVKTSHSYQLGTSDTDSMGIRGFSTALTLTAAPAAVTAWATGATVAKGAVYEPSAAGGPILVALNSGITGATEPTWPTVVGETVTDLNVTGTNGIVWLLTTTDKTQTYVQGTDYLIDDSELTGGQFLWTNTASDALAVFASYTPKAVSWSQIAGGQRLQYDGYAEFHGDVEGAESVLKIPGMTVQSSGTLSTVTENDTFIQIGLTGTFKKLEGQDLFTWNGRPVVV